MIGATHVAPMHDSPQDQHAPSAAVRHHTSLPLPSRDPDQLIGSRIPSEKTLAGVE